ncbi:MAG: DUF4252 domain-containing protein [Saprospiraceae bacterium]|nr:DUF4252 domain-containing protein [Saprospiraceae bacterium]
MISKYFLSILLIMFILPLMAQKNIDQIFRKYKNDEGVVNMNFTGEVLKMFNESKANIKSTIENVDILVFKKGDDIDKNDKAKIKAVLTRDKFDLLVDVKNKTQKVQLYAIDGGKYLNKVFAHINMPDMNAYFVLSGNIIFEELAKLGMDFQSGEGLKILQGK